MDKIKIENEYMHNLILEFKEDIVNYNIPKEFNYSYLTSEQFNIAKEQVEQYLIDSLSIKEINHPDNTLRNVMKIWPIAKNKFNRLD